MTPDDLLDLFSRTAAAVADAVGPLDSVTRRARTDRPGQYHLDTVADAAALRVLADTGLAVLSEESGHTGPTGAPITVVIDPVDGSTNCARGIPYWATALCALDREGPLVSLVTNHATGSCTTAVRGQGVWRDGRPVRAADVDTVARAVVALDGMPRTRLGWRQFRSLGSQALALCDLAAGVVEGYMGAPTRPWDYMAGLLACTEAGAVVIDAEGRPLVVTDASARRRIVAACTPALLAELRTAL